MKTSFLFLFIAVAGLTACKKSSQKNAVPTTPNGLLARTTWHTIESKHQYYDSNNNRVYKYNDSLGVLYNFNNGTLKVTNVDNTVTTGNYTISNNNLAITINNHTDNFQVDTLTENYLYLTETTQNAPYTYNGTTSTAAQEVFTLHLKCACQ